MVIHINKYFSSVKEKCSKEYFSYLAYRSKTSPKWVILSNYPELRHQLLQFLEENHPFQPLILFPPSLDWNTQLFQRPQQMALGLAKSGATVFYFQPPPYKTHGTFEVIEDHLVLCHFPIELFSDLENPYLYLLTWNHKYAKSFLSPRILYDLVDDLSVFAGNTIKLRHAHDILLRDAELVITSSHQLHEQVISNRPDAILCPNGVDYEFIFNNARSTTHPLQDLLPILNRQKPVIGYYGALAHWFDYSIVQNVAKLRPDYSFVLIGPDYDSSIPADLLKLPNVDWLGPKPYLEIPSFLHYFDVAIIPFVVNQVTNAVSPLKLFEYMAAQKPVVVTPMRECIQYWPVLYASTPKDFAIQLDKALDLRFDQNYISQLTRVAQENTWLARASQILGTLEKINLRKEQ